MVNAFNLLRNILQTFQIKSQKNLNYTKVKIKFVSQKSMRNTYSTRSRSSVLMVEYYSRTSAIHRQALCNLFIDLINPKTH